MSGSKVQVFNMFKQFTVISVLALGGAVVVAQSPSAPRAGVDWPGFRGIAAAGVDDAKPLPVQWSVPESKLVKWRVPVAGLGHSSPVVWGDHVCTASAISGTPDPQLKVGLYGDIGSVLDTTEHASPRAAYRSSSVIPNPLTRAPPWRPTAATSSPCSDRKACTRTR